MEENRRVRKKVTIWGIGKRTLWGGETSRAVPWLVWKKMSDTFRYKKRAGAGTLGERVAGGIIREVESQSILGLKAMVGILTLF